jgi:hypothetical protein
MRMAQEHTGSMRIAQQPAYLITSIRQLHCDKVAHPHSLDEVTPMEHHHTHDQPSMPEGQCAQRKQRLIGATPLLLLLKVRPERLPLLLQHVLAAGWGAALPRSLPIPAIRPLAWLLLVVWERWQCWDALKLWHLLFREGEMQG